MNDRYNLPVPRYSRFWGWLLRWLQHKCHHFNLKADMLEGCGGDYAIRWCETCGAICHVIDGTPTPMRYPEPNHE